MNSSKTSISFRLVFLEQVIFCLFFRDPIVAPLHIDMLIVHALFLFFLIFQLSDSMKNAREPEYGSDKVELRANHEVVRD